jgi:hypothetical protein
MQGVKRAKYTIKSARYAFEEFESCQCLLSKAHTFILLPSAWKV